MKPTEQVLVTDGFWDSFYVQNSISFDSLIRLLPKLLRGDTHLKTIKTVQFSRPPTSLNMRSGHSANPIFFNEKIKIECSEHSLHPLPPLRLITSHFCLNPLPPHPHPHTYTPPPPSKWISYTTILLDCLNYCQNYIRFDIRIRLPTIMNKTTFHLMVEVSCYHY